MTFVQLEAIPQAIVIAITCRNHSSWLVRLLHCSNLQLFSVANIDVVALVIRFELGRGFLKSLKVDFAQKGALGRTLAFSILSTTLLESFITKKSICHSPVRDIGIWLRAFFIKWCRLFSGNLSFRKDLFNFFFKSVSRQTVLGKIYQNPLDTDCGGNFYYFCTVWSLRF